MTIDEASKFFKNLITETEDISEVKIYKKFVNILLQLESREFSDKQLSNIIDKLDDICVEKERNERKKYFKKELSEFLEYLKKEFSFVSEQYYANEWISLGMSLGMIFGLIFARSEGFFYGMFFGMSIGLAIGAAMDQKAKKEGKVLSVKCK